MLEEGRALGGCWMMLGIEETQFCEEITGWWLGTFFSH